MTAFVRRQGQQDNPLALVAEEGRDAVFTHIGGDGQRVNVVFFEEGTGIHGAGVANVATFGVGNDEVLRVVLLEIFDGLLEGHESLDAEGLVESEVGLVRHAIGCGGVDDSLVKRKDGVFFLQQVLGNLL